MLLAPLPFEYVAYFDRHAEPGQRTRRAAQSQSSGTRVRRSPDRHED